MQLIAADEPYLCVSAMNKQQRNHTDSHPSKTLKTSRKVIFLDSKHKVLFGVVISDDIDLRGFI